MIVEMNHDFMASFFSHEKKRGLMRDETGYTGMQWFITHHSNHRTFLDCQWLITLIIVGICDTTMIIVHYSIFQFSSNHGIKRSGYDLYARLLMGWYSVYNSPAIISIML